MFEIDQANTDISDLNGIRRQAFGDQGYYVFKNFLTPETSDKIRNFWINFNGYEFSNFIPNKQLAPGSPKYKSDALKDGNFSFCTHIWNNPSDELLHETGIRVQQIRNLVEGKPTYFGLHENTGKALQYRVCRSLNAENIVHKHADFFELHRRDPMGDHSFDPSRLQATLFLSDYADHYEGGGFKLWLNDEEPKLFGRDIEAGTGDLVLWRYTIFHEVNNVRAINPDVGFLRVIFPLLDTTAVEK